jgi:hypothetical protein
VLLLGLCQTRQSGREAAWCRCPHCRSICLDTRQKLRKASGTAQLSNWPAWIKGQAKLIEHYSTSALLAPTIEKSGNFRVVFATEEHVVDHVEVGSQRKPGRPADRRRDRAAIRAIPSSRPPICAGRIW